MKRRPSRSTSIHAIWGTARAAPLTPIVPLFVRVFAGCPVGQALHAYRERRFGIGRTETIASVSVPHVPQIGAKLLSHAYAVAGVCARCNGLQASYTPVLTLHLVIGFESSASEHEAGSPAISIAEIQ